MAENITYNGIKEGDKVRLKSGLPTAPLYEVERVHTKFIVDLIYEMEDGEIASGGRIDASFIKKARR